MFETNLRRKKFRFTFSFFIQPVGLIFSFVILTIGLLFGQLLIANKLATDGESVSKKELMITRLAQENTDLENQIASLGSLSSLKDRAQSLGMIKVSKIEVISQTPYAFVP